MNQTPTNHTEQSGAERSTPCDYCGETGHNAQDHIRAWVNRLMEIGQEDPNPHIGHTSTPEY